MNNKENIIKILNANGPKLISLLGGRMVDIDREKRGCVFEFDIGTDYCHSIDVVQGGFITAMLDVAMSHSLIANVEGAMGVSSLEIKTSYLDVTRAGRLRVEGYTLKHSYKTAFMEGRIYNADNVLTATASSVGKIIRPKN
jgi:uncharacterized protein (TIGR00369 family)